MLDELGHTRLDDIASREALAAALTRLREHAGLSIRDLSKRTGVPSGTISGYFTGRHVPPASALPQFTALLSACGVDPAEHAAWIEACARVRRAPGRRAADAPVPYRGLRSYEPGDEEWYVGRESLVDALDALVAGLPAGGIAVLVGASGTGKSSLVRAGLLPRTPPGRTAVVTPGEQALQVLRAVDGAEDRRLVVLDQAEELFAPGAEQLRDDLLEALADSTAATLVVLRSDFYAAAAEQALLVPALQSRQLVVTPPTEGDLRRIILEPARAAGLEVEPGFADMLLRDVSPRRSRDGNAPLGVLPLLSHALLATCERSGRRALRSADYRAIGGLEGAVARSAEDAYQRLTAPQQARARDLFLGLVHVVDGAPVARRGGLPVQPTAAERAGEPTPHDADEGAVLDAFVEARLLTTSDSGVTLAHEALLWAWPRLASWIDADREGQLVARTVAEAARLWDAHDREPDLLHRGGPLSAALTWSAEGTNAVRLSPLERDFLTASQAQLHQDLSREARRARRARSIAFGLAVLLVAAVTFAGLAVSARGRADHERQLAVSRLLALTSARVLATDPAAALQLAAAAYRTAPTFEARSAVLTAAGLPVPSRVPGSGQPLQSVDIDRDGLLAVGGAGGEVRLLTATGPGASARGIRPPTLTQVARLQAGTGGTVFAVALSPDGTTVAAAGADGAVYRWRITDPRHPEPLPALRGPTNTVYSLAWAGAGGIAAGSADGTLWWYPANGQPRHVDVGSPVHSVAVSPGASGGTTVAAGSDDGGLRLWRPDGSAAPVLATTLKGAIYSVAWSPDGTRLAVGGTDRTAHLLDVSTHRPTEVLALTGPTSWVNDVQFDPSGTRLLGASSDRSLWVWDTSSGQPLSVLPHSSPVTAAHWSADGRWVSTVANDGLTRVWQVPGRVLGGSPTNIFSVPTTADGALVAAGAGSGVQLWRLQGDTGQRLGSALLPHEAGAALSGSSALRRDGSLVASGGRDGTSYLWRLGVDGTATALPPMHAQSQLVEQLSFSPDGAVLAAGSDDSTVALTLLDPSGAVQRSALVTGPEGSVQSVTFSPDSRYVAAGSVDRTVRVWDLRAWRAGRGQPTPVGAPLRGPTSYVYSVAWSPDGRFLAAGSDDRRVWVWDVTRPAAARRIATLTAPTSFVYTVAWSPQGTYLAAGIGDGETLLWRVVPPARAQAAAGGGTGSAAHPSPSFKELEAVSASTDPVYTVTFAGNRDVLLTSGADRRIHLWGTDVETAISSACSQVGAPLTAAEWHELLPSVPYTPPCGAATSPRAATSATAG